jgi:hypothetical protein
LDAVDNAVPASASMRRSSAAGAAGVIPALA